ncbi:MAG: helix-turn-helix domain-containing protein [Symplocastrum torsivum CPER-KK1]|uniref:Helix-turn-helix domain-containing protein n=1 Tax=Symplocastrum torsivum CPER-KK1 TaxID=450513 RepID=A0A951PRV5_9CYAN|nr:helix-turn-helix domain-containing protein [Symplocastrum torsivum CPER-KK1]
MKPSPRPLGEPEQNLLRLYTHCQLGMTPQKFYSKWDVSQEQIASICDRSILTVRSWFGRGQNSRSPLPIDLRHLALMDFLLEHWEDIPESLRNQLCPPER